MHFRTLGIGRLALPFARGYFQGSSTSSARWARLATVAGRKGKGPKSWSFPASGYGVTSSLAPPSSCGSSDVRF
eukprot:4024826-Alexandrium_andersonii.AAC.1